MRFALLLLLGACGRIGFDPAASRFGDASSAIDAPADAAPLGPFGPFIATSFHAAVSTPQREYGTTISDDGLEIYWSTYRTDNIGNGSNIWRSTRGSVGELFSVATQMTALNSDMDDGEPTLSRDGRTIYFQVPELLVATRPDPTTASWSTPVVLDSALDAFEGADLGPGDLRLVLYNPTDGAFYEASRPDTASPWGTPQLLVGFGIMGDGYPSIRADGLEIFWETDRSSPRACWHAFRTALDQPFTGHERIALPGTPNTFQCGDPDISGDGKTMVFVSTAGGTGEYDVWTATRMAL